MLPFVYEMELRFGKQRDIMSEETQRNAVLIQ